jgi:hypothetical protein
MQWRLITPGVVLVVGCGVPTTVGYIQSAEENQAAHTADVRGAEHLQLARELPANPPDVAVALTEFIGDGGPSADGFACLMFSPTAADELAAALDTASCPAAIQALHNQVSDPGTYINAVTIPPDIWSTSGDTGSLNGCAVTWTGLLVQEPPTRPGPLPGHLTLSRQDGKGWLITGYQGCWG